MAFEKELHISPFMDQILDHEMNRPRDPTFNTHFELITSRPVLMRIIEKLDIDQREKKVRIDPFGDLIAPITERVRSLKKTARSLLKELILLIKNPDPLEAGGNLETEDQPSTDKFAAIISGLRGNINVQWVKNTRLLNVSVDDYDPVWAKDIANSLARLYIEFDVGCRVKSDNNTIRWMTEQLYRMKKELEEAEEAFLAYKQRERLFSVEGKQKTIAQKIWKFNDAYLGIRNERHAVDARLKELNRAFDAGSGAHNVRALIENPLVSKLYKQLLNHEVQLSRLNKVYKAKHPKVIQIRTKIEKIKKGLTKEVNRELQSLKSERSVLAAREGAIKKTISGFEQEALATNRKELKYSILQRDVETYQNLYDALLSQVKQTDVIRAADVTNIWIAEEAVLPVSPVRPNKLLYFVLCVVQGLMMGIGVCFLLEYMDRSLHDEGDVQSFLDLPVLSVIPEVDKAEGKRAFKRKHKSYIPVTG
ncbi:MAG: GumC family protein [Deltaproteobacteria bacterium]|nr:GumC family protein [Deltaproteobacteria bacterium]